MEDISIVDKYENPLRQRGALILDIYHDRFFLYRDDTFLNLKYDY